MHAVVAAAHRRFHEARADLFVETMRPCSGATLLDLGGSRGTFAVRICERVPLRVTVADVQPDQKGAAEACGFRYVTLEGSGRLPFADGEFDFVLSNSVIEHVTLPKERCRLGHPVSSREWTLESERNQETFAGEIRRVGKSYFVQTPHKHFPIDPHIYLPFAQYLSHNVTCRLVRFTDQWWLNDCGGTVDWHLLTPPDMRRLFPGGEVRIERFLGFPKSIVAYRRVTMVDAGCNSPSKAPLLI